MEIGIAIIVALLSGSVSIDQINKLDSLKEKKAVIEKRKDFFENCINYGELNNYKIKVKNEICYIKIPVPPANDKDTWSSRWEIADFD